MPDPTTTTDNTTVDSTATSTEPLLSGADATQPAVTPATKADPQPDPAKEVPKPAEEKKAEEAKTEGAPEKYEPFKAPEGVTLNAEMVDEFSAIAKEANLSQEQAQKFADLGPKLAQKQQEAITKQWADTRAKWASELKTDKEIGGNNFEKSTEVANRGIALASKTIPEIKGLREQGWFDHPGLFKVALLLGKLTSEDRAIDGTAAPTSEKSAAQILYPSTAN